MSDIREVPKYLPLKDGFCLILLKFYKVVILPWMNQDNLNFYQTFLWLVSLKKLFS